MTCAFILEREDHKPAAIHAGLLKVPSFDVEMNQQHANFDPDQRRAGIRRTAWIVGSIAFAIFVLFFLQQGIWR